MNDTLDHLQYLQRTAIDLAIQFGPRLLVALAIIAVGIYAGRWVARFTQNSLVKFGLELPLRQLLARSVHLCIIALFAIMALQNLGVDLLPLIAGLGVIGAGVALATQGALSNVVAGLTIIFTKPFRVGEFISIVGEEGEVENISLFNTVLSHTDRSRVVIPNRKLVGEILHNYGTIRQLNVTLHVAHDTELNHAHAVIQAVLLANPRVLREPAPIISVNALEQSGIGISVRPWVAVADYVPAIGELHKALVEACRTNGIAIPLPQQEIRILNQP